ncbi:MAG: metallophosphoesterase [Spirochaetales bacterium]|nr:metallophosphoesterase [Spirochaetales bacterium]
MNKNGESWLGILGRLESVLERRGIPELSELLEVLSGGIETLRNENPVIRPVGRGGSPGGLVRLKPECYYVIIPDLHGRLDFFHGVMSWTGFSGQPVISDMAEGRAQVICVGDAFHSESRGRERWQKALKEYAGGFKKHKHMDREMGENLGLLEMINLVKITYPEHFHFLKGNHENIANEKGEGNFPFRKYAYEGEMVKHWVQNILGMEAFDLIYRWEKALPLLAEGAGFLVTHCEPGRTLTPAEVINCYENPDVIFNLTWIDNNQAEPGSTAGTLKSFGKDIQTGRIFGGHRPVKGYYDLRQDGLYVQINTPNEWVIAAFGNILEFLPDKNIVCLKKEGNRG